MLDQLSKVFAISPGAVGIIIVLLAVTITCFDVFLPDSFAAEYLYTTLIFLGLFSPWRNNLYYLTIALSLLTILGYLTSSTGIIDWHTLPNRLICIAGLWLFAFLSTMLTRAENEEIDIVNTALDGIITINEEKYIESFNPAAEKIFGYAANEVLGRNISLLMPSPYREQHNQYIRRYIKTGEKKIIGIGREVEGLHKDGTVFPMELAVNETYSDGKKHFVGIVRDISDRKQLEEKFRNEYEFNLSLINTAKCIILTLDKNSRIVFFNPYMEQLSGYALAEVQGSDWIDTFIPPGEQENIRQVFSESMDGTRVRGKVYSITTKNGDLREIEWFDSPLTRAKGEISGILSIGQDITERQEVHRKLIIRTQQLMVLSDLAQQVMSGAAVNTTIDNAIRSTINTLDTDHVYLAELQTDRSFARLHKLGHSLKSVIEYSTAAIDADSLFAYTLNMSNPVVVSDFQKDDRFRNNAVFDKDNPVSGLSVLVGTPEHPYGVMCTFVTEERTFTDDDVNFIWSISNIVTIAIDRKLTETRTLKLQNTLSKVARVSAIGKLGTTIIHEINQPITAMINYTHSCRRLLRLNYEDLPGEINTLLNKIVAEAERTTSIIHHLRNYIAEGVLYKNNANINQLVKDTIELIRIDIHDNNIVLHTALQSNLPAVYIDNIQIQQVIFNLLHNSMEALEQVVRREIKITTRCDNENTIEVAVHDTGPGVSTDILSREFGFSISGKEHGLSIGLPICKSIIEAHDGCLSVFTAPDGGTVFKFTLPAAITDKEMNT